MQDEELLRRIVMAFDADQDEEFDRALEHARKRLGLKLVDDEPAYLCAMGCGYPVRSAGSICGECACEEDGL